MSRYYNNFNNTTNFSDLSVQLTLTDGTEQTYTVPGDGKDKYQALFGYDGSRAVLIGLNSTISIPSDDNKTENANIEVCPDKRFVSGGDTLHFMTPETKAWTSVSLRKLPG